MVFLLPFFNCFYSKRLTEQKSYDYSYILWNRFPFQNPSSPRPSSFSYQDSEKKSCPVGVQQNTEGSSSSNDSGYSFLI